MHLFLVVHFFRRQVVVLFLSEIVRVSENVYEIIHANASRGFAGRNCVILSFFGKIRSLWRLDYTHEI